MFDELRERLGLIRLHVDEKHIRQIALQCRIEFIDEIRLHRLNRDDEKDAEADDHDDDAGLIAGTVQAVDGLLERERAQAIHAAHEPDQQRRRSVQTACGDGQSYKENQADANRPRLPRDQKEQAHHNNKR